MYFEKSGRRYRFFYRFVSLNWLLLLRQHRCHHLSVKPSGSGVYIRKERRHKQSTEPLTNNHRRWPVYVSSTTPVSSSTRTVHTGTGFPVHLSSLIRLTTDEVSPLLPEDPLVSPSPGVLLSLISSNDSGLLVPTGHTPTNTGTPTPFRHEDPRHNEKD